MFRLVEDEALINRLGFNNHGAVIVKERIKSDKKLGLLGINVGPNKDSSDRLNDYLIGLKTFYNDADIKPMESFFFTITIYPLATLAPSKITRRAK